MSGPFTEDPRLPSQPIRPLVAVLLAVLREHTDAAETGTCPICRVSRCERWRWTGDELHRAGYELDGRLRWADLVRPEDCAEETAP